MGYICKSHYQLNEDLSIPDRCHSYCEDEVIRNCKECSNLEFRKVGHGVMYSSTVAPFCPVCGSGEWMYNEDGNENDYCGQCGTRLDWDNMINEDYED